MDEKIREIEEIKWAWRDAIIIGSPTYNLLCRNFQDDIKILLSHISTLEERVKELKIRLGEAQQWIDSEPDWKEKYNLAYKNALHEIELLVKRAEQAESRIKEYEEDRHRLACEISKLREQHHDDCKLVAELQDRIKKLE